MIRYDLVADEVTCLHAAVQTFGLSDCVNYVSRFIPTKKHCTALPFIALHCTTSHTKLHHTTASCTTLHNLSTHFNGMHCSTIHAALTEVRLFWRSPDRSRKMDVWFIMFYIPPHKKFISLCMLCVTDMIKRYNVDCCHAECQRSSRTNSLS
jgi:hypothetical protein